MKNKATAGICLLMCVVLVFSILAACGKKGGDAATTVAAGTTIAEVKPENIDGQGLGNTVLVDMTKDEVIAFVKDALGDAAKDFNGDLSTLTSEQLSALSEKAEQKGYIIETRPDGKTYIVKTVLKTEFVEISEPELAAILKEALGDAVAENIGSDTSKLTDEQLAKVTEIAEDRGYVVQTDDSGKTTIGKNEATSEDIIVQPTTAPKVATDAEIKNAITSTLGSTRAKTFNGDMSTLTEAERTKLEEKFNEIGANNVVLDKYWSVYFPLVPQAPTVPATQPPARVTTTKAPTTTKSGGGSGGSGGSSGGSSNNTTIKYTGTPQTIVTATTKQALTTSKFAKSITNSWISTDINAMIYNASAVTPDGGVVVVGNTESTPSISGVITKYKADGTVAWSHTVGGNDLTILDEVAVLSDGNIIAVGETHATNIVDEQYYKSMGTGEGMIIKYSPDGTRQWLKLIGGEGADMIYALTATPDGGFALGGKSTSLTGDFAGYVGPIRSYVMKYNASGTMTWKRVMAGNKHCAVVGLCVSPKGELFACYETKTISGDFAGIEGLVNNRAANLIVKYSAGGDTLWATPIYEVGAVSMRELTCSPDGGVIVVGQYAAARELNKYLLKGVYNGGDTGTTDGLIVKLGEDGEVVWVTPVVGFQNETLTDIAPITGGYVISGYSSSNNRDFAWAGNNGDYDAFVYVVGEYGNYLTMMSLGGTYADTGRTVCSNGTNLAYFAGTTSSNDKAFAGKGPTDNKVTATFATKLQLVIS